MFSAEEEDKFFALLKDPSKKVKDFFLAGEDLLVASYEHAYPSVVPLTQTRNVFLAAFVTCWARLHLYELMLEIGFERVMYCDTDSVIFTSEDGEEKPVLGDYLGESSDKHIYLLYYNIVYYR